MYQGVLLSGCASDEAVPFDGAKPAEQYSDPLRKCQQDPFANRLSRSSVSARQRTETTTIVFSLRRRKSFAWSERKVLVQISDSET